MYYLLHLVMHVLCINKSKAILRKMKLKNKYNGKNLNCRIQMDSK